MNVLKNREIYALATDKTWHNPANLSIKIDPFILTSVNPESYTLRAGENVTIYHQGEKTETIIGTGKEGLWLQPETLYCIKVAEHIEFKHLDYLISGLNVINAIRPKNKKTDNFTVWIEPTQTRYIYRGMPIAEMRFIRERVGEHLGITPDVETFFNSIDKKIDFRGVPQSPYIFDKRNRFPQKQE